MTTRGSAAAAAALLKPSVKRIIKVSTCITLGITKESIKQGPLEAAGGPPPIEAV